MKRFVAVLLLVLGLVWVADRLFPPPQGAALADSERVLDADGGLLRLYTTPDGYWRLPLGKDGLSPLYRRLLLAYEDQRFDRHPGFDPLAMARAAGQWLAHGRVVSGASTLSMQTARLLDPGPRTVGRKALEIWRAMQLEWRMDKDEILALYLRLAPYGGNIQGLRAAALLYFGREPLRLTPAQAALLIALPQNPEARRPDRHPDTARAARDRVLRRLFDAGRLSHEQLTLALRQSVPTARRSLPLLAPHLADRLHRAEGTDGERRSLIEPDIQRRLQRLAERQQTRLPDGYTLAALVVRNRDRAVVGHLGSGDYFGAHGGMLDLTRARRSPGSVLKPLLYGIGFDLQLLHPETLILDAPYPAGDYAPVNFDGYYHGAVSARQALQQSLNVPAVKVLAKIGPRRAWQRLRAAGADLALPRGAEPGLPLALGGVGASLETLVSMYVALATDGRVGELRFRPDDRTSPLRLLGETANAYVGDILEGTPAPSGNSREGTRFAFKTGTSYGFRDAWAIGFDGGYTIGVWVGQPNGSAGAGRNGRQLAAPLLFDIRRLLPDIPVQPRVMAGGEPRLTPADLPAHLRWLEGGSEGVASVRISWPRDGSTLALGPGQRVRLTATGGRAPYHWLVNGRPLASTDPRWLPDGPGANRVAVVDTTGVSHAIEIWVEQDEFALR